MNSKNPDNVDRLTVFLNLAINETNRGKNEKIGGTLAQGTLLFCGITVEKH